jgi:hypothetical protein
MTIKMRAQPETLAAPIPIATELVLAPNAVVTEPAAVTETQTQELAYKLYEERGRVDGSDQQDWFEAEAILRERGKLAA